ncbi:MAG: hypothetical protein ACM3VS_08645 [Candidatus Dadabacteria bacterium]
MARQTGIIQLSGTINEVTYYRRNGKTFSRKKSSLNRSKIRTGESFAPTRALNDKMKFASPIASGYYQSLSPANKSVKRYRKMFGLAQHLLAKGSSIDDVHDALKKMRDEFENPGTRSIS